jgi:hypothetical protein
LRLNPLVLALTLVIGITGVVFAFRAVTTYSDAAEAFTQVELHYVPGSFEWEDPEFETGSGDFRIVNDSQFPVTVESFTITLNFDDDFAGSDYSTWQPKNIAPGEALEVPVTFTVTSNSIQALGGTALLRFAGQLRLTFVEFEEPLAFRFQGNIGETTYER